MAYIGRALPLPLVVLYNVCVDTTDENFVPFSRFFGMALYPVSVQWQKTWTVMIETQQVSE
jgi:hypothetical protein